MTSLRHIEAKSTDDVLLDAAREAILAVGWRRSTLTDVARRAGVSRMTIYRRWSDMTSLLSDLMTREWATLAAPPQRAGLPDLVAGTVRRLRDNALFRKIVEVDPELLLPYLIDRRGRTQDAMLATLTAAIRDGQKQRTVRRGNAGVLARGVLLTATAFAVSAPAMADTEVSLDRLDRELRHLVDRYLAP